MAINKSGKWQADKVNLLAVGCFRDLICLGSGAIGLKCSPGPVANRSNVIPLAQICLAVICLGFLPAALYFGSRSIVVLADA
ncbi:hypothetical protein BGAL_0511g00090 [Botrytis galanthina]|uniref:Uncharacterized protein n=1 Tax=Botrytis galanthina TaxID=278940 RepID=A0A4S8QPY2_9HELO|nr:hypothetical protein BGAL_0511g00090 [Botrytis galanthina]